MKKVSITPRGEWTLSDGTKVVDFTNHISPADRHPSFCFGYIFDTIYMGSVHHAEIMAWLQEQGRDWVEMFESPQRWGWCYTSSSKLIVRFATDDAKQSPGLGEQVVGYFDEFFVNLEVQPESLEGYSSQDNYGQRTRVQYQGDPEGEDPSAYCEYCDNYYDPEWESHDHEKYCSECGVYYTPEDENLHDEVMEEYCGVCAEYHSICTEYKHGYNHSHCEYCMQHYDEGDEDEVAEHESPYCYTDGVHYDPETEGEAHRYHETTETGDAYKPLPEDQSSGTTTTYLQAAKNLYAQLLQRKPTYDFLPEGLEPIDLKTNPAQQVAKQLMEIYPIAYTEALTVAEMAIQEQGNQMALFSKWEDRTGIDRGIHDDSDRYVFSKLAADLLTGVREDQGLLDIEANPNSTEYRWSYDGHDLHMWQVTNRRQYGPSHYDMFGSEGYDFHSQGRVYVSPPPDNKIGSLFWQISHPECEDVVNQWIQQTFGRPADYVYHSYGQYPGEVRGRGMYPLVDVMWLPFKDNEKWWLDPSARPNKWYEQQGLNAPKKKRQKKPTPYVAPSQQGPSWKNNPAEGISEKDWKNMSKKERRRLRRDRRNNGKGQGKVRGRGRRMGNFNVISYEYNQPPGGASTGIWDQYDALVHKFVFDSEGSLVVAEEPQMNISGETHHGEMWNEDDFAKMGLRSFTNGFLSLGNLSIGGNDLREGDVWFHERPEPAEIKAVKSYFGDKARRLRWWGMNGEST